MTDLYNGELLDLLKDSSFADNVEVQCLSYALKKETQRMMDIADSTLTSAGIDMLPEKILDVLAVELRAAYYDEDFSLSVKREVIKNTLRWYMKAGTPEAVNEFITSVFGHGGIVEWFNYTEAPYTPGTFDVMADSDITEDAVDRFTKMIENIKNVRSHIRHIIFQRVYEKTIWTGVGALPQTLSGNILPDSDRSEEYEKEIYYRHGDIRSFTQSIIPNSEIEGQQAADVYAAQKVKSFMTEAVDPMEEYPSINEQKVFHGTKTVSISIKNIITQGGN